MLNASAESPASAGFPADDWTMFTSLGARPRYRPKRRYEAGHEHGRSSCGRGRKRSAPRVVVSSSLRSDAALSSSPSSSASSSSSLRRAIHVWISSTRRSRPSGAGDHSVSISRSSRRSVTGGASSLKGTRRGLAYSGSANTNRLLPLLGWSSGVRRRLIPAPEPVLTATYWRPSTA